MILLSNSRLRRKLLTYAFTHPDENFYVRELALLIAEDPGNLSRELRRLEAEGLYRSTTKGKERFYSLNKDYPLFAEIKEIVFKSEGADGSLRQLVSEHDDISLAFIYGSYASGKEKKGSDIDLVLVGKIPVSELTRKIRGLEKRLGREINFNTYTSGEFEEERAKKGSFLNLVLAKKCIVLKGALHG